MFEGYTATDRLFKRFRFPLLIGSSVGLAVFPFLLLYILGPIFDEGKWWLFAACAAGYCGTILSMGLQIDQAREDGYLEGITAARDAMAERLLTARPTEQEPTPEWSQSPSPEHRPSADRSWPAGPP